MGFTITFFTKIMNTITTSSWQTVTSASIFLFITVPWSIITKFSRLNNTVSAKRPSPSIKCKHRNNGGERISSIQSLDWSVVSGDQIGESSKLIGRKRSEFRHHKPLNVLGTRGMSFGTLVGESIFSLCGNQKAQVDLSVGETLTTSIEGTNWRTSIKLCK